MSASEVKDDKDIDEKPKKKVEEENKKKVEAAEGGESAAAVEAREAETDHSAQGKDESVQAEIKQQEEGMNSCGEACVGSRLWLRS